MDNEHVVLGASFAITLGAKMYLHKGDIQKGRTTTCQGAEMRRNVVCVCVGGKTYPFMPPGG